MTEIDNRIAKMPAKMAFAVLALRKVHACLMELPRRSKSVQLAKKAAYLNYIEGEGRKLGKVPLHYERLNEKGESVTVETYFRYLDRIH